MSLGNVQTGLVAFSPSVFPMSVPLSAILAPEQAHLLAQDAAAGNGAKESRGLLELSSFKREDDPALEVAAKRMGSRISDAVMLVRNGSFFGGSHINRFFFSTDKRGIRQRLFELLNERGVDVPEGAFEVNASSDGDFPVLKVRGEGEVPREHFIQYGFFQRENPPVLYVRRQYTNKGYRGLHAEFIRSDLGRLPEMGDMIREDTSPYLLNLGMSTALAIEIGIKHIMNIGGEQDLRPFWDEGMMRLLDMAWDFFDKATIVPIENDAERRKMEQSYIDLVNSFARR